MELLKIISFMLSVLVEAVVITVLFTNAEFLAGFRSDERHLTQVGSVVFGLSWCLAIVITSYVFHIYESPYFYVGCLFVLTMVAFGVMWFLHHRSKISEGEEN